MLSHPTVCGDELLAVSTQRAVDRIVRFGADGSRRGVGRRVRRRGRGGRAHRRPGHRSGLRRRRLVRRADRRVACRPWRDRNPLVPAARRRRGRAAPRRQPGHVPLCRWHGDRALPRPPRRRGSRARRTADPQRLRRVRDHRDARVVAADRRVVRGGRGVRDRRSPRWPRGGRGVASRRPPRAQAERVRRLPRRRRLAGRRGPGRAGAVGDPRPVERRPPRRRRAHPAPRPLPRRVVRGAAARHDPVPPVPDRPPVDRRVRRPRRGRGLRLAARLLAVPPRGRGHGLPGDAVQHRRGRHAGRPAARPQDGRPVAGGIERPGRAADPALSGGPRRSRGRQAGRQAGRRARRRAHVPRLAGGARSEAALTS